MKEVVENDNRTYNSYIRRKNKEKGDRRKKTLFDRFIFLISQKILPKNFAVIWVVVYMKGMKVSVKEFIENGKEILTKFKTYLPIEEIYDIVVNRINKQKLPLDSKLTILQCVGYDYLETADSELIGLHVKVCIDEREKTLLFSTHGISDVVGIDIFFEESAETEDNTYYEDTIIILSEFDNPYYFDADELAEADRNKIKEFEENYKDAIHENRVYVEHDYDVEGKISPVRILVFSDEKEYEKYSTAYYLTSWNDVSERTKKLALSTYIHHI